MQRKLVFEIEDEDNPDDIFDKMSIEIKKFLSTKSENNSSNVESFFCDDCGQKVSKKVHDYSKRNFNDKIYCMNCQPKHKEGN